jgi:hypothetical protein
MSMEIFLLWRLCSPILRTVNLGDCVTSNRADIAVGGCIN